MTRKSALGRYYCKVKADTLREDGRLERHCAHGIGHTVGHVSREREADKWMWMHGCDGCCALWDTTPRQPAPIARKED